MRNLILLLCTVFLFSCKKEIKDESLFKVQIRGIQNCVQAIEIFNSGKGSFKRGTSNLDSKKDFKGFDDLEIQKEIKPISKEDLDKLKNIIYEVKSKTLYKKGFLIDAQRYEIYIDGVLKIDVYGFKSEDLIDILKILYNYLPEKIAYNC